jgi:DNA-directed RNA polymerase alpha subunit
MDDGTPAVTNIADVELEQFDLSVRTRNCLHNSNIKLVGELTALSAFDISRWRNAGKKTLQEIRELLGSIGLKLKGDPHTAAPINAKLLHQLRVSPQPSAKPKLILREAGRDVQRRLVASIASFSLSTRAKNVIVREKLQYMAELVQLNFGTLLAFDSSGKKTATELASLVKTHGLVAQNENSRSRYSRA